MKNSDWYKLSTLCPGAACNPYAYFGITKFSNVRDYLYPDRSLKKDSTVIWVPEAKAHIGIASYIDAKKSSDKAALEKLTSLGIPLDIDWGYQSAADLSKTYVVAKKSTPQKKKSNSTKVMRAKFAASFEDGTKFKVGDVVKIIFRKKFVKDYGGTKKFQNAYERPTKEELDAFLATEN